jgi:hypothetical protein
LIGSLVVPKVGKIKIPTGADHYADIPFSINLCLMYYVVDITKNEYTNFSTMEKEVQTDLTQI